MSQAAWGLGARAGVGVISDNKPRFETSFHNQPKIDFFYRWCYWNASSILFCIYLLFVFISFFYNFAFIESARGFACQFSLYTFLYLIYWKGFPQCFLEEITVTLISLVSLADSSIGSASR